MKVFRLAREKYASDLTGEGAKLFGGRWNTKGHSMLYTSSSRSLAILEVLVNMDKRFYPQDMMMISIELSIDAITEADNIPENWREVPVPRASQIWGDGWLSQNVLATSIPSIVVPQEKNILLNPTVVDYVKDVVVTEVFPFTFDSRVFT